MRPERTRVWRKGRRSAFKGIRGGRRVTHTTRTEAPRRGSTWLRRHPSDDEFLYWLEAAR